jgi:hypothetical protein
MFSISPSQFVHTRHTRLSYYVSAAVSMNVSTPNLLTFGLWNKRQHLIFWNVEKILHALQALQTESIYDEECHYCCNDYFSQMYRITNFLGADNVFHISTKRKSNGLRSRPFGGQGTGSFIPIYRLGNLAFGAPRTWKLKWGWALSC